MINKVLKIGLVVLLIVLVVFLIAKNLVWSGCLTVQSDLKKYTPYFSIVGPEARTQITKEGLQILEGPVYFDLKTPRPFDTAKVTLTYENPANAFLELGVNQSINWSYDLKAVENPVIDQLNWSELTDENLRLLMREKNYNSLDKFQNFLPVMAQTAVYQTDLNYDFEISDYKASTDYVIIGPLLGSYKFYTYIKNENLDFNFSYDYNVADLPVELSLYDSKDNLLSEYQIKTSEFRINEKLSDGVYRIELLAPKEFVTSQIKTTQQKIAFINVLNLGSLIAPVSLISNSQNYRFNSYKNTGLQELLMSKNTEHSTQNTVLEISEVFKDYDYTMLENSTINVPKGEINITSDGLISWTQNQYFNPVPNKISAGENLEAKGINYILTTYQKPLVKGNEKVQTAEFDLKQAYIGTKGYHFMFSLPIKPAQPILIKNIKIELNREPMTFKALWDIIRMKYEKLSAKYF